MDLEDLLGILIMVQLLGQLLLEMIGEISTCRFWVRGLHQYRDYNRLLATSFNEMHQTNPEQFQKSVQMSPAVACQLYLHNNGYRSI